MKKNEVMERITSIGIVPSVRVASASDALFAGQALYTGGIPLAEITLTLAEGPEVIRTLVERYPDMVVGAGTVLDVEDARRSIDAGASFVTSPGFVPGVAAYARERGVVVLPGALTPSEVIAAWQAGADMVKIYPAAIAGGSRYIRALKVPLPQIPLMVSGGVNQLTAFDYILAGAGAIGVGGELLPRDALSRHQEHRIHELAQRFLSMVSQARLQRDAG